MRFINYGCVVALGILLVTSGLLGLVGSMGRPGATRGLGSVLVAFVGVCISLVGLVAGGHRNIAEAILSWFDSISIESVMIGGLIVGIVLAAISPFRR
jgi:hypothetical protein